MEYRKISSVEISKLLNLDFYGPNVFVEGLNFCDRKSNYESILSFTTSSKYLKNYEDNNSVKILFLTESLLHKYKEKREATFFVSQNPEELFYKLHDLLLQNDFYNGSESGYILTDQIHPSAVIDPTAKIGKNVIIGANSVVCSGSEINDNVIIGCNTVIGAEGFQIIFYNGIPQTIRHVGGVYIENNVFIGDSCSISKSLFEGCVVIKENTKIDSQVHIGHNCIIGANTVITANCVLMGSVEVGNNVWIAPSSTISNKVKLSDDTFVGSSSLVNRNSKQGEKLMGSPALEFGEYMKLIIKQKKYLIKSKKK